MKKKNKIILYIFSALLVIALTAFAVVFHFKSKPYPVTEKSIVAMGTVVTEKIYSENPGTAIKDISAVITGLENLISSKKKSTDVFLLNETGKVENKYIASIIPELSKLTDETEGKFDITVGALTDLWGIGTEKEKVPSKDEIQKALSTVGKNKIKINENKITLAPETKIDLGAVGKGFAADLCRNYLASSDIKGAVISVGGTVLAFGSPNKKGDKWKIAVRHPRNEEEIVGIISAKDAVVSTSGDYERYFEKDGKRYHHILDATTGYPGESDLISATVVCESGILSDALSTCCFLLGKEKGRELLEKYGASGIFVDSDLNVITVGEIDFERK